MPNGYELYDNPYELFPEPPEPPRAPEPTWGQSLISNALSTGLPIAGGIGGFFLGMGPWGSAAGAGLLSGAGDYFRQQYELGQKDPYGTPLRQEYNPWQTGVQTGLGTIPGITKFPGTNAALKEIGKYGLKTAGEGAILGAAGTPFEHWAETGDFTPTAEQVGWNALIGGGMGGALGTAIPYGLSKVGHTAGAPPPIEPPPPTPDITAPPVTPSARTQTIGGQTIPEAVTTTTPTGGPAVRPAVLTIRTPNAATIKYHTQEGYTLIPELRSPDGYMQMVLNEFAPLYQGGARPPNEAPAVDVSSINQPTDQPVAPNKMMGEDILGGDTIQLPTNSITPQVLDNLKEGGYHLSRVRADVTEFVRRAISDTSGQSDWRAMWQELQRRFGRPPSAAELEEAMAGQEANVVDFPRQPGMPHIMPSPPKGQQTLPFMIPPPEARVTPETPPYQPRISDQPTLFDVGKTYTPETIHEHVTNEGLADLTGQIQGMTDLTEALAAQRYWNDKYNDIAFEHASPQERFFANMILSEVDRKVGQLKAQPGLRTALPGVDKPGRVPPLSKLWRDQRGALNPGAIDQVTQKLHDKFMNSAEDDVTPRLDAVQDTLEYANKLQDPADIQELADGLQRFYDALPDYAPNFLKPTVANLVNRVRRLISGELGMIDIGGIRSRLRTELGREPTDIEVQQEIFRSRQPSQAVSGEILPAPPEAQPMIDRINRINNLQVALKAHEHWMRDTVDNIDTYSPKDQAQINAITDALQNKINQLSGKPHEPLEGWDTPETQHQPYESGDQMQLPFLYGPEHSRLLPNPESPEPPYVRPLSGELWQPGLDISPIRGAALPQQQELGIQGFGGNRPRTPEELGYRSETRAERRAIHANLIAAYMDEYRRFSAAGLSHEAERVKGHADFLRSTENISRAEERLAMAQTMANAGDVQGAAKANAEADKMFLQEAGQMTLEFLKKRSRLREQAGFDVSKEQVTRAESVHKDDLSQYLGHGYARAVLANEGEGPPGFKIRKLLDDPNARYNIIKATYRNANGRPIGHVHIQVTQNGNSIPSLAIANDAGIGGMAKAAINIAKLIQEYDAFKPSGSYSPYTLKVLQKLRSLLKDESGAMPLPQWAQNLPLIIGKGWDRFKKASGVGQGYQSPAMRKAQINWIDEAFALPAAATTTGDLSAPGRQGLTMFLTPGFWRGLYKMFPGGLSHDGFVNIDRKIRQKPLFQPRINPKTGKVRESLAEELGVKLFTPGYMPGPKAQGIASRMLETGITPWGAIPGISAAWRNTAGIPIRMSNRAFITFLNVAKAHNFESLMNDAERMSMEALQTGKARTGLMPWKQSFTPQEAGELNPYFNKLLGKEIADFINTASGQGPLRTHLYPSKGGEKSLEFMSGTLSKLLFSPGLMASRVRMLNPNTYMMASPYVRKQYLRAALSAGAGYLTMTSLIKAAAGDQAEVSDDPTSADFGKVRIGDTRFDAGGGFQQYLVAIARAGAGGYTSSSSEEFHRFGQGFQAVTQGENAERFMSNKLNPLAKFAYDLAFASEYKPFHTYDRSIQMVVPLIIQDLVQLKDEDPGLMWGMLPAMFGMGTQIYSRGESVGKFIDPYDDRLITGGGLRDFMPWNQEEEQNFWYDR